MAKKITLTVTESIEELKRLFHLYPYHLHPRIQMLYLIKFGITDSTKVLSTHLFTGTRVIQTWKRLYEKDSLKGLLNYQRGKNISNGGISELIHAAIREQLSSPTSAFTSYRALHGWVKENHLPEVSYQTVHFHAKVRLKAKLKAARKSHIKKDVATVEGFKKV